MYTVMNFMLASIGSIFGSCACVNSVFNNIPEIPVYFWSNIQININIRVHVYYATTVTLSASMALSQAIIKTPSTDLLPSTGVVLLAPQEASTGSRR